MLILLPLHLKNRLVELSSYQVIVTLCRLPKLLEEKELSERFGEAYLAYKKEVPFIIPRLPRRR